MYKDKTFLAIITARGISKGLPGKNIMKLSGKPLVSWTIDSAKKSEYIDRTIVSTDCKEIARLSEESGAEAPFIRPDELSGDATLSTDVIIHCLDWIYEHESKKYDYIILLQPTSPLRNEHHIDDAIRTYFLKDGVDTLVSVTEATENPYWLKIVNKEGCLDDFIENKISRRQDLPKLYALNGAIYISGSGYFKDNKTFFGSRTGYYYMEREFSIDIDDIFDFRLAEYLMEKTRNA